MLRKIDKLQTQSVKEKELADAVNIFLTKYYSQLETNKAQADFSAKGEISGIGWQGSFKFVEQVKKLTPQDINECS